MAHASIWTHTSYWWTCSVPRYKMRQFRKSHKCNCPKNRDTVKPSSLPAIRMHYFSRIPSGDICGHESRFVGVSCAWGRTTFARRAGLSLKPGGETTVPVRA